MIYGGKGLFSLGIASDLAQLSLRVSRDTTGAMPINFPEPDFASLVQVNSGADDRDKSS